MTTPFLGRIGEHPNGLTFTKLRDDDTCGICWESGPKGAPGVIPESCTPFSTSKSSLPSRIYQEFARIFPSLRPHAHGEQTRHIFHTDCFKPWFAINPSCPTCRNPINPDAMLTTVQKLRKEMHRCPKIWSAIGAVFTGAFSAWAGVQLGLSRHYIKLLEYGTAIITYGLLTTKLGNQRQHQN